MKQQLEDIKNFDGTRILYSSKYNINKDLNNLFLTLGNAEIAIVSEITKLHENVIFATLPFELNEPKGEFVLVIKNAAKTSEIPAEKEIIAELNKLTKTIDKNDAIKLIKDKYKLTKSYVYNLYERNKK